jgi:hypothetical protein
MDVDRAAQRMAGMGSVFCGCGGLLALAARVLGLGLKLGLAAAIALALDGDDVGVVDDAVDQGGGTGCVGEDGGPIAEGEVGGQDEAFLLVVVTRNSSAAKSLKISFCPGMPPGPC